MKKVIFLAVSIMILSISCNKNSDNKRSQLNNKNISTLSLDISSIEIVTFGSFQMLKFDSWEHFDTTAKQLDNLCDAVEESFYDSVYTAGMTDDVYNDIADSLGFTNEVPLINFENALGFNNSYRVVLNNEMETWLDNETLDINNCPKNKTLFSGGELSLINNKQQVMIGDTVYWGAKDGYFAVGEDYNATLNLIDETISSGGDYAELDALWFYNSNGTDCKLWEKNGVPPYETSDKKIVTRCGIRSFAAYCKFLAEISSYQKKNNKWKSFKTDLKVALRGEAMDVRCNYEMNIPNKSKNKKKAELEANSTILFSMTSSYSSFRAENGVSVIGDFEYYGQSSTYILAW